MPSFSKPQVFTNDTTATSGSVVVNDTTWSWSGGTIFAPADYTNKIVTPLVVYNCTVGNSTTRNGNGNWLYINSVVDNYVVDASSSWGCIYVTGNCLISGSTFSNCENKQYRGIIAQNSGSLTVDNSLFVNNISKVYGIIHRRNYYNGVTYVSGSTFRGNKGGSGGALSGQAEGWFYVSGTSGDDAMLFERNWASKGGAIASDNSQGQFDIKGATFSGNYTSGTTTDYGGGAIWNNGQTIIGKGTDGTRTQFIGNTSASWGGAISHRNVATGSTYISILTVSDAIFDGNISWNNGGGAIAALHDMTLTGNTFVNNYASSNGGALYINGGSATLTGNVFSGNTANETGGAINVTSNAVGVTINGGAFLTGTDTINSAGAPVEFTGDIELNASVSGTGFSAKNAHFTLKNSEDISLVDLGFSGEGNTIVINGTAAVNFNNQKLTNVGITVKLDKATTAVRTIADGFTGEYTIQTDMVKDSSGYYKGASELLEFVDGDTSLSLVKKGFVVSSAEEFYAKVQSSLTDNLPRIVFAEAMTINCADSVITLAKNTNETLIIGDSTARVKFAGSAAARMFKLESGSRGVITLDNIEFSGSRYTANGALVESYGTVTIKNSLIADNTIGAAGIGSRGGCITSSGTLTISGSIFRDNNFTSNASGVGGGAIYSSGTATVTDTLFQGNTIYKGSSRFCRGAAIGVGQGATFSIYGSSFIKNASLEENHGAIYADQRAVVTIGGYNDKITLFEDNAGGAFYGNVINSLTVNNVKFFNNDGSGAIRLANNSASASILTISNAEFEANSIAVSVANANGTISNSKFLTATDDIYIGHLDGVITLAGEIDIVAEASIFGIGTYILDKGVSFTSLRDFSDVYIAVDGADWDGVDTVIASNVAKIGQYGVIGNKDLMLSVNSNNELVLSKVTAIDLNDEKTVEGTANNLLTSGKAETFIASKTTEAANLITSVAGGIISNALVGGAYAKATDNGFNGANIGNVELNFSDLAAVAGKVYAGGYFYGDENATSAAASAQMNVARVRVNLDGGAVSGNMYGGVHVRDKGNAKVEIVDITVTNGTHGRVYAGGWAEKGAKSYVTTSNVTISGGVVDYLYGAGANADGQTYVTTTNITIENDAQVNTIFMGGRYGYSYVTKVNLTFAGENKELTRLSGVSSAGMDYSDETSVVLQTNLTADLIDYVDKFTINENCKLIVNDEFFLGSRDNETGMTVEDSFTTFNFVTDGLKGVSWEAIAGISDFTNAKFSINGVAGVWAGNVMAITHDNKNYTITKDESAGTITLAQV